MTLIKSISGIRGTIGGEQGDALTPVDIVKFTCAYTHFIQKRGDKRKVKIVLGRDARISGLMVNKLVKGALMGMGAHVIDAGLSTTPTVEVGVMLHQADGGIILTASHNPKQWNALKLLNEKGEFLSASDGEQVLSYADSMDFDFAKIDQLGIFEEDDTLIDRHIEMVLDLDLVDKELIKKANFEVAIDAVNSTGGIAIPKLLKALGVDKVHELYCTPNGEFPHNPEPLPENLFEISELINTKKIDVGFVVDPDVDRLAIVTEKGEMFGEEYTLVAVADYILQHKKGNTVSNLSSTRALKDVTQKYGGDYFASAVGEVNVVEMMKSVDAIIGGEGNGGVIYPEIHYGRDALVGIALFLTYLAKKGQSCSELKRNYRNYHISKNKIELTQDIDVDAILAAIAKQYKNFEDSTIDGVKVDFENEWVHLRKSNTEPIIRIYAEAETENAANTLAQKIIGDIKELLNSGN